MPAITDEEYLTIKIPKLKEKEIERITEEIKEVEKQRDYIKEKLNKLAIKIK